MISAQIGNTVTAVGSGAPVQTFRKNGDGFLVGGVGFPDLQRVASPNNGTYCKLQFPSGNANGYRYKQWTAVTVAWCAARLQGSVMARAFAWESQSTIVTQDASQLGTCYLMPAAIVEQRLKDTFTTLQLCYQRYGGGGAENDDDGYNDDDGDDDDDDFVGEAVQAATDAAFVVDADLFELIGTGR
jgi:hypothetical protein